MSLAHAVPAARRTLLRWGRAEAGTVEHLLAACVGLGIWDAQLILDGPELPALDGSATGYAEALWEASGPSSVVAPLWRVVRPFAWGEAEAGCRFEPASGCRATCEIAFAEPTIGRQRAEHDLSKEGAARRFRRELAPARTFGLACEAEALRRQGLARGASLENAVVFGANGPLNPDGLRFPDEPVRHKLVDLLGDLALLGGPLQGHVGAFRASHRLVQESLRRALQEGAVVRVAGGTPG